MKTSDAKPVRRLTRVIVTAACTLAVIGYPFSVGPFAWAASRGYIPVGLGPTLHVLYYPFIYVWDTDNPAGKLLEWYVGFWVEQT